MNTAHTTARTTPGAPVAPAENAPARRRQGGVMLLEALIAILIFSIGVLSIVKLQGHAVKESTDAEFRSAAALLADDLISRMWGTDRKLATLQAEFGDPAGNGYTAWHQTVIDSGLPNITDGDDKPSIAIQAAAGLPASTQVTVTLTWRAPGEDINTKPGRSRYVTTVVLRQE